MGPYLFTAHPLEPALTAAVLRVLDVLACMQERPPSKVPVHIAPVRTIARGLDDRKQAVRLFLSFSAAVPPASRTLSRGRPVFVKALPKQRELLV